jgi:hypothetical protein
MSTPASRRHPEPEALAAFLEGGLAAAELTSVTEHLSDCIECRALLGSAAAFAREHKNVRELAPHRTRTAWWLAAAASIAIVAGAVWTMRPSPDPLQRLVSASPANRRELEPRLSGGFPWAPLRVMRGGSEPIDAAQMRLMGAAGEVLQETEGSTSPRARHAAGVAQLLSAQRDDAIRELEAAAQNSNDARTWSDLAAAHYVSAMRDDAPAQLTLALKAADKGLELQRDLPEGLFNRALILERLGLRDPALAAWKRYLAIDASSPWANEARQHVNALSKPHP